MVWLLPVLALWIALTPLPGHAQNLPLYHIAYGTSGENPTALWVGEEQGFYRKHNVNIEAVYMRAGFLAMSAMVAGEVQVNFTSTNTVLNGAAAGLDIVMVATVIPHAEGAFVARPEIQKPEDLKGKVVGIQSIGGGGWANNMLALDYLGLEPERDGIQFLVVADQASRIQALETGKVQASWLGYTFAEPLKKKGFVVLVDLGRAPISYLGPSLVIRRLTIEKDPKFVEGLIKGTIDSVRFVLNPQNKPVVVKTLMRRLRLSKVEEAESGYRSLQGMYATDFRPKVEGVKKIYAILLRANPKLQKINPASIIEDSVVQKIHDSGY
jgi:ABC-type nitrate/sulfonate/bicarbonate transport system substrate-binding protein